MVTFDTAGSYLASCGGGGGGNGNDTPFLGGIYRGTLFLSSNTCPFVLPSSESFEWTVNQDGEKIVLDSSSGQTFVGAVTGNNSFQVAKDQPSSNCVTTTRVQISEITSNKGHVDLVISAVCSRAACSVNYEGQASRSS